MNVNNIHTYIIDRNYVLIPHTAYDVVFVLIVRHGWWNLQIKVDAENHIFGKLFMEILVTPQSFCQTSNWDFVARN